MSIKLGNITIAELYLGSQKISEAYLGSTLIYNSNKKPYFVFEFSVSGFIPTSALYNAEKGYTGTWTQVSSSPNVWKLEIDNFVNVSEGQSNFGIGCPMLFATSRAGNTGLLVSSNLGGGTCKLIDSGNLDMTDSNGNTCQSMDRMFTNCTGLTEFSTIQCVNVTNVGGTFSGCTEVIDGAYDQYVWFNTYGVNINNHSGTFTDCGSNTVTGLAELQNIPVGWGGLLVPASTLMTSTVQSAGTSSNKIAWTIDSNNPTWTDVKNGMYLFTEASVSSFAGVSMNRSRIKSYSLYTSQSYALYFYPSFVQTTSAVPGNGTAGKSTWLVTTNTPNGNLTVGQGNTDMPGTLDFGTYGAFAREYGTYDSNKTVYFAFLVTNVPIDQWTGLEDRYGFLYNSNFKTDAALRWFFE